MAEKIFTLDSVEADDYPLPTPRRPKPVPDRHSLNEVPRDFNPRQLNDEELGIYAARWETHVDLLESQQTAYFSVPRYKRIVALRAGMVLVSAEINRRLQERT